MIITLWCKKCARREVQEFDETTIPKVFFVGCKKCRLPLKVLQAVPGTVNYNYLSEQRTGRILLSVNIENK